jgi:glycosyltransferase involved in cell wall biosynthesis
VNISLVVTTLNEAETITELLDAIDSQTRPPDQIVFVDGGSSDGTLEMLSRWADSRPNVIVESAPGANIATGRNLGIARAAGPVIAITDAGCRPEATWMEELEAGFASPGVEVVMGFYRPDPRSAFEAILSCLNLPDAEEVAPERFMPSSRSIAFLKFAWKRAGGYPEWLDIGEDMYFDFRLRQEQLRMVFAPRAVVRWRLRAGLPDTMRQYFQYARGDALGGMYPERHALRFLTYLLGAGMMMPRRKRWLRSAAIALLGLARMRPAYARASRRLPQAQASLAYVALPALELLIDLSKMAGYAAGLSAASGRGQVRVRE